MIVRYNPNLSIERNASAGSFAEIPVLLVINFALFAD